MRTGDAPPRLDHRPALDGVRGVAVLLVVVFHCWPGVIPGGLIGVDLFLVLSGYLITTLLLDEWRRSGRISLPRFYGRRALRLLPALTVMTATCAVVVLVDPASGFASSTLHAIPLTAGYVANWAYAGGSDLGLLAHTWSLSVEEQFYILWPVLLIGLLLLGGPRLALLGALTGIVTVYLLRQGMVSGGATWLRVYGGFDTRADALLAGCTLALGAHLTAGRRPPLLPVAVVGLVAAAGLVRIVVDPNPYRGLMASGFTLVALCAAGLLAALVVRPVAPLVAVFSLPPLVEVGRVSYGIYLWHYPLLLLLYPQTGVRGPVALAVVGPLTLVAASLSHAIVEAPFLALKRRLVAPALATIPGRDRPHRDDGPGLRPRLGAPDRSRG
ncbi:MAG TPA: acyltransferase [Candidatus Dormibacteraeota bacterium]